MVISRNGKKATINQTKCIAVKGLRIPERDLRGRALEREPADQKEQDRIIKRKLAELRQKLRAARQKAPSGESGDEPEEDIFEDKPCPEEDKRLALAKTKPERKQEYKLEDLKSSTVVVVYVFEATRLAKYMFHRQVEGDKDPWVRLHLYEAKQRVTEANRIYYPTWKSGNRDILATNKKDGWTPFWVDVYLKDIVYILRYPLKGGRIDERDLIEMGYGAAIQILALVPAIVEA